MSEKKSVTRSRFNSIVRLGIVILLFAFLWIVDRSESNENIEVMLNPALWLFFLIAGCYGIIKFIKGE